MKLTEGLHAVCFLRSWDFESKSNEAKQVWKSLNRLEKENTVARYRVFGKNIISPCSKIPSVIVPKMPENKGQLYWRNIKPLDIIYQKDNQYFTSDGYEVFWPPNEDYFARTIVECRANRDKERLPFYIKRDLSSK